jgi:hypothetical protein
VEQRRPWLESLAESVAGGKVTVGTAKGTGDAAPEPRPATTAAPSAPAASASAADADSADRPDLRARALADDGVQAMLEIFPAEIREVEEIK